MDRLKILNNLYSVVNPYTYRSNPSAIADTGALGHYMKADAPHELAPRPVATIQANNQMAKAYSLPMGVKCN